MTDMPLPPKPFRDFVASYPEVAEAHEMLGQAVRNAGPLSPREVALVKLGISIGARMEGAAHAHVRNAVAAGVDAKGIEQVALLSCPTLGFPNMMAALGWVRETLAKD